MTEGNIIALTVLPAPGLKRKPKSSHIQDSLASLAIWGPSERWHQTLLDLPALTNQNQEHIYGNFCYLIHGEENSLPALLSIRLAKHHWRIVWKQSKGKALTKSAPGEKGPLLLYFDDRSTIPLAYPRRTVLFSHGAAFGPEFSGASLIHYRGRRSPAGSDGQLTRASAFTLRFSLCG